MKKSLKTRLVTRFRKNPFLSAFLHVTGRNLNPEKWVFIIGCYNSGTTLLDEILSQHPDIGGMNEEGVMLTKYLPKPEDYGWRRMWWRCEEEMKIEDLDVEYKAHSIKRHWSHFFDRNKKVLLEKSISNTARLDFFQTHFQPAYFIHIVRNGYAVAEGIRRRADVMPENTELTENSYPIEYCAMQWKRSIEKLKEQLPVMKNFLEISYEDLTENPTATLDKISDFLSLPPLSESIIEKAFHIHGTSSIIKNMNEESLANLTKEDVATINSIAGNWLQYYKYYRKN